MAEKIGDFPNTVTDSDFPDGGLRDETGVEQGTDLLAGLHQSVIQAFQKMMRLAGITYNGLPDNEGNGYQFLDALRAYVRGTLATTSLAGVLRVATTTETATGTAANRMVTPSTLFEWRQEGGTFGVQAVGTSFSTFHSHTVVGNIRRALVSISLQANTVNPTGGSFKVDVAIRQVRGASTITAIDLPSSGGLGNFPSCISGGVLFQDIQNGDIFEVRCKTSGSGTSASVENIRLSIS